MKRLVVLALVVLSFMGCETAVTPIVGTTQPYTIFGYLGAERDTQRVHVIPVRDQLDLLDPSTPIDARVFSTNIDNGEEREWNDSLVFFDDGSWAHVYWSEFRAIPLDTYRIDVQRSDGATSTASTKIPLAPTGVIEPPTILGTRLVQQRVRWTPATRLVDVVVEYDASAVIPGTPDRVVEVPYNAVQQGNDWVVDVNLSSDFNVVTSSFPGSPVILHEIRMKVFSVDDAWVPPGGVFDFELLSEPGTLDNVDNGFGFVGAGVRETLEWLPDSTVLSTIGYTVQ